ncbi:hypothetical protein DOY81_004091 [Sarcophaga bullata]|nr:hypothetical protein DOY81_004091 [Sarcophaga bullata]
MKFFFRQTIDVDVCFSIDTRRPKKNCLKFYAFISLLMAQGK